MIQLALFQCEGVDDVVVDIDDVVGDLRVGQGRIEGEQGEGAFFVVGEYGAGNKAVRVDVGQSGVLELIEGVPVFALYRPGLGAVAVA